jgi:hypothetical protein
MPSNIKDLELLVARCRVALDEAEAALRLAKTRQPEVGDFGRSPLTNFFGRVTRITHRPHGRPWVEITPYLTDELAGRGTLDLYDSWELIDPPANTSLPALQSVSTRSR